MYLDFEELVFNISRTDKLLKPSDLKNMSVFEFYNHKKLLEKEILTKKK